MDFDLFVGNHDIKQHVYRSWAEKYDGYLTARALRPTIHTTFTRLVMRCQVWKDDADQWFDGIFRTLTDLRNLSRIRAEMFFSGKKYALPTDLLVKTRRPPDGELVVVNPDAFTKLVEDMSLNYEILHRISPRDLESVVAAFYARSGLFDRVILTPVSGDLGRDIILERDDWGPKRIIVEVKRYRRRKIDAEKINSLLGVLTAETPDSMAALYTTSSFAPRVNDHPSIRNALSSRLVLVDFLQLVETCIQCEYSNKPEEFLLGK